MILPVKMWRSGGHICNRTVMAAAGIYPIASHSLKRIEGKTCGYWSGRATKAADPKQHVPEFSITNGYMALVPVNGYRQSLKHIIARLGYSTDNTVTGYDVL